MDRWFVLEAPFHLRKGRDLLILRFEAEDVADVHVRRGGNGLAPKLVEDASVHDRHVESLALVVIDEPSSLFQNPGLQVLHFATPRVIKDFTMCGRSAFTCEETDRVPAYPCQVS